MKGTRTRIRFNAYSLCICDGWCEDDCHSAKHRLREGRQEGLPMTLADFEFQAC